MPRPMTNREILRRLEETANLKSFSGALPGSRYMADDGDAIREATRLYRETYMQPMIDLLKERLLKDRG